MNPLWRWYIRYVEQYLYPSLSNTINHEFFNQFQQNLEILYRLAVFSYVSFFTTKSASNSWHNKDTKATRGGEIRGIESMKIIYKASFENSPAAREEGDNFVHSKAPVVVLLRPDAQDMQYMLIVCGASRAAPNTNGQPSATILEPTVLAFFPSPRQPSCHQLDTFERNFSPTVDTVLSAGYHLIGKIWILILFVPAEFLSLTQYDFTRKLKLLYFNILRIVACKEIYVEY